MSSTHNLFCTRSKDNKLEAIKVSELIEQLQKCDPDDEIWLPKVNGFGIPGYCVLDHVMNMTLDEVVEDVRNNPGEIDHRLLHNKTNQTPIIYLGSIPRFKKSSSIIKRITSSLIEKDLLIRKYGRRHGWWK